MHTFAGYTVTETLHEGRSSVLYRARRDTDQQPVIVKALRAEYPSLREIAKLRREYDVAHNLGLDGIVTPIGVVAEGSHNFLVLEDTGGKSLKETIPEGGMDLNTFFQIAIDLTDILDSLHRQNVIHLDVKPGNMIIDTGTGQVKLTDFGIASLLNSERQIARHPQRLEGTLAYMSPEQTGRIRRSIDYRSDLYSLGVSFYEMLTGTLPFSASDSLELVHAHIAREPVAPHEVTPRVPVFLSEVVLKLLRKSPDDRYQSTVCLRNDLQTCWKAVQSGMELEAFTPATDDVSPFFQIPQKLYGRESDLNALHTSFDNARRGGKELVLVTGTAGIGKSALVNEIDRRAVQDRGFFIAGKFDQLQRTTPYNAFIQAFRELIRQILTESEQRIADWKQGLLDAFGSNGQIIIDVIPELELIVGPQPEVPAVTPLETQNRFNLTWLAFIRVFASARHPLVLFLDDLQWADAASLNLIQLIIADEDIGHLLLIGAFRDSEVDTAHPLSMTIQRLEDRGASIDRIALEPLTKNQLTQLISETLRREPAEVKELGALVFKKTSGNPFFVHAFLNTLYRKQHVTFDYGERRWCWDLGRIRELDITDNVVALMTDKITRLSADTRHALTWAACIGNVFDLSTLATVLQQSPEKTVVSLWEAIEEEIVLPHSGLGFELQHWAAQHEENAESPVCKFLHDRVQHTAYSLIEEGERAKVHLRIGQLLYDHVRDDAAQLEERLFDVVHHLNLGRSLLNASDDKRQLAGLNIRAARKALSATAYQAAIDYAMAGIDMLEENSWQIDYALVMALHSVRAEAAFLIGRHEEAESIADIMLDKATSMEDKIAIYDLKIRLYTNRDNEQAIAMGIQALRLLGFSLPASPKPLHIVREFLKARWYLLGKEEDELLRLPEMTDETHKAISDLVIKLLSPTFLSQPELAIVLALKMFNVTMRYGLSRAAPMAFVVYGVVNANLGNFERGYVFGELAMRLLQQRTDCAELASLPTYVFAVTLNHRRRHARDGMSHLQHAYEMSLEAGDLITAEYCLLYLMFVSSFLGDPLEEVESKCKQFLDFFRRVKGEDYISTLQGLSAILQRQFIAAMRGKTSAKGLLSDASFSEEDVLSVLDEDLKKFYFHYYRVFPLIVFREFERALIVCKEVEKVIQAAVTIGEIREPDHYFHYALVICELFAASDSSRQKRFVKILNRLLKKLKKWADNGPENSLHKYMLVRAEVARNNGRHQEAMAHYDEAIAAAGKHGYRQDEALANELAARYFLALHRRNVAKVYLQAARFGYAQWGAVAKVEALDREYGGLMDVALAHATRSDFVSTTTSRSADILDLTTVMKASQALSGQIVLDRLLTELMQIALENAGARRGLLIRKKDGQLVLEAEGSLDDPEVKLLEASVDATSDRVPRSIINYVMRTEEEVVLADAVNEGRFKDDPYIMQNGSRSILSIPLVNQGNLIGILYLENELAVGAFTPQRIELLKLLSAQMAISIENARLYNSLEQKVEERTEELRNKNETLESTLKNLKNTQAQLVHAEKMASLGELTSGIAHEMKNPLNFINNFAELNIEIVKDLRQDLEEQRELTLGQVSDNVDELLRNLELNADRISHHGKRANRIVQTMMEHARGAAGVLEHTDLNRLLKESGDLALHGMLTKRPDFSLNINTSYEEHLPLVQVRRLELIRAFVNMLDNAFYAVQRKAEASDDSYAPAVTIETKLLDKTVEIRIEDNGTGIPDKVRDKIFVPFFTTKPAGSGTGLGLSLSYDIIVQGHGGSLDVESEEGAFTRFIIRLPIA